MDYDLKAIYNRAIATGLPVQANSWLVAVENGGRFSVYTNKQISQLTYDKVKIWDNFVHLYNINKQNRLILDGVILCEFSAKQHLSRLFNIHTQNNDNSKIKEIHKKYGEIKRDHWLGEPNNSGVILVQQLNDLNSKIKRQFILNKFGIEVELPVDISDMHYNKADKTYSLAFGDVNDKYIILNEDLKVKCISSKCSLESGVRGRIKIQYSGD